MISAVTVYVRPRVFGLVIGLEKDLVRLIEVFVVVEIRQIMAGIESLLDLIGVGQKVSIIVFPAISDAVPVRIGIEGIVAEREKG